jgi:ubiquinone/menaquinone biosynthesis C-methylase UbiE
MNANQSFNDLAKDYDNWFEENSVIYKAEIETLAGLVPKTGSGLEIGVGTGRFAAPLGIRMGIDPARQALRYALVRDILVCQAVGERLPFNNDQFDFALLNTVDPFVNDIQIILTEIHRVLDVDGRIIIGMIDRDSHLGQIYDAEKDKDPFFREAHFHSTTEIIRHLESAGFSNLVCRQTLIGDPFAAAHERVKEDETIGNTMAIQDGFGMGAFVALRADKLSSKPASKFSINTGKYIPKR